MPQALVAVQTHIGIIDVMSEPKQVIARPLTMQQAPPVMVGLVAFVLMIRDKLYAK